MVSMETMRRPEHDIREGAPGSSVGRASDSRSRGSGFETHTGHLVVASVLTLSAVSEGRCVLV